MASWKFHHSNDQIYEMLLKIRGIFYLVIRCSFQGNSNLGGGFKYISFMFTPILGENIQFDEHIFLTGGLSTN